MSSDEDERPRGLGGGKDGVTRGEAATRITPTLPWAGPLGLLPFPTKWYIDFGEPIDVSAYGPEALKDRVLINRLNEHVRGAVQDLVAARLRERRTVFGG